MTDNRTWRELVRAETRKLHRRGEKTDPALLRWAQGETHDRHPDRTVHTGGMTKAELIKRLSDYDRLTYEKLSRSLNEKWQQVFPEAALEQSDGFLPLVRDPGHRKGSPHDPDEIWFSPVYNVTLRRHAKDPVFRSDGGMIQLGISAIDGTARHDWREFQQIKNQLAGSECEAFELYPAESRLLDPSNYYTLWCFPGVRRVRIGEETRRVFDTDQAFAPQRGFAPASK